MTDALALDGLTIAYRGGVAWTRVVHDATISVAAGEVVALVGESGSGKTTLAQAALGLLPANGRVEAGTIRLHGIDITRWPERRMDAVRGAQVSLVPQDPGTSLNPVRTIGAQLAEVFALHGKADAWRHSEALLERVGLVPAKLRMRQYPHELSGGMKQRVLIAMAVALRPGLIVADEPTSALDVTVQRRILDLLDELRRETGTAILLITHDLAMAAARADRVVVLQGGQVQEQGAATQVLTAPVSAYTRRLIADAPSLAAPRSRPAGAATDDAIIVADLVRDFPLEGGKMFRAVDGVSFHVRRGTTHAIVGESGSGKTTTARCVAGLDAPTAGGVVIDGLALASLRGDARRQARRRVQLVYQNPFASLDPRMTVGAIVAEPLRNFARLPAIEAARRVGAMLERVGLADGLRDRLPRALSGGQRQRVAIARALILEPAVLVLDEAVSALDVTVQAQVLRLLEEVQRALALTYLFVSHDLAVVRRIADTASVMQGGRLVETGPVETLFDHPEHAYTRELIAAIPTPRRVA